MPEMPAVPAVPQAPSIPAAPALPPVPAAPELPAEAAHAVGGVAMIAEFGGGVYGAVAAATLLYLEAVDLAAEVAAAGSLKAFMAALNLDWLINQAIESIGFAIRAALWPWYWLSEFGVTTALLVALAVWAFDAFLRSLRKPADGDPVPAAGE